MRKFTVLAILSRQLQFLKFRFGVFDLCFSVFHCPEMAQMMKGGETMKMGPTQQQQSTQILQLPRVFIHDVVTVHTPSKQNKMSTEKG